MKLQYRKPGIILLLLFVIFIILGFLWIIKQQNGKVQHFFCQSVSFSNTDNFTFSIHPIKIEDKYLLVIPAYWNTDSIRIRFHGPHFSSFFLNGEKIDTLSTISLSNMDRISAITKSTPCSPQQTFPIIIEKSRLNALFINTESGSMNAINNSQDKSVSEKGTILAVTPKGEIEYQGKLTSIHGRGNMTWSRWKKPYSIKLNEKAKLFGLKKAKNFNLLANACDETSLRNWIMLHTAEALGLPNAIRSNFTILYLNGKYYGLFQITNKVKIGKSGVDIFDLEEKTQKLNDQKLADYPHFSIDKNDTIGFIKGFEIPNNPKNITGGYLLEQNFKLHRYAEGSSGFIPQYGYPAEIKAPEHASREQVEYIRQYLEETMGAIRSKDGKNPTTHKHYSEYIDIDSYIYYYLFSEIFYNLDAVNASLLMYKDKNDKLFCGPMWDYDLSLNTKVYFDKANGYNSLFVREAQEADGSLRLFGQLYQHPEYKRRLIQIFNQEILPIARSYYQGTTLDSIHDAISQDLRINQKLWQEETDRINSLFFNKVKLNDNAYLERDTIDKKGDYWNIKNFLCRRCEFLAELWKTPESEGQFQTIIWNFGRIEQFQHVPTRVAYFVKGESWTWPRYMISDAKDSLINVTDANGKHLKENEVCPFINLVYKQK